MFNFINKRIELWKAQKEDRDYEEGVKHVHDTIAQLQMEVDFAPIKFKAEYFKRNDSFALGVKEALEQIEGRNVVRYD